MASTTFEKQKESQKKKRSSQCNFKYIIGIRAKLSLALQPDV